MKDKQSDGKTWSWVGRWEQTLENGLGLLQDGIKYEKQPKGTPEKKKKKNLFLKKM